LAEGFKGTIFHLLMVLEEMKAEGLSIPTGTAS